MCNLCSSNEEERLKEKRYMEYQAGNLHELAGLIEDVANGRIDPHSDKANDVSIRAHNSIRYLVENWM